MRTYSDPTIAIVGCGGVTAKYYAPAIEKAAIGSENVVFVDPNERRAKEVADTAGGGRTAPDYADVLDDVDGAVIAVPHSLHYPIATEFLEAGKHVLVEKPLTETRRTAERLVRLGDENDVHLAVNNTRRLFPTVQATKEFLDSDRIGEPEEMLLEEGLKFNWEGASGFRFTDTNKGILMDIGAHVLDIVCYWLGEQPTVDACRDDSHGGIEAVSHVDFRSSGGVTGSVKLSWLNPLSNTYEIRGTDGTISFDYFNWNAMRVTRGQSTETIRLSDRERTFDDLVSNVFENFLRVIEGEADPIVPGSAVVDSIGFIEDCYESREPFDMPWLNPQP